MHIPAGVDTVDIQRRIRSIHLLEMPDDKDGLRFVGAAVDELRQHRSIKSLHVSHVSVLHSPDSLIQGSFTHTFSSEKHHTL